VGIAELGPNVRLEHVCPGQGRKTEEDTMVRLAFIAIISTALMAGVAANAENQGGYVVPELGQPASGICSIKTI
jgi:hypothetical protein